MWFCVCVLESCVTVVSLCFRGLVCSPPFIRIKSSTFIIITNDVLLCLMSGRMRSSLKFFHPCHIFRLLSLCCYWLCLVQNPAFEFAFDPIILVYCLSFLIVGYFIWHDRNWAILRYWLIWTRCLYLTVHNNVLKINFPASKMTIDRCESRLGNRRRLAISCNFVNKYFYLIACGRMQNSL